MKPAMRTARPAMPGSIVNLLGLAALACLGAMGSISCADRVASSGGGSEAGNAIVFGRVVDGQGLPVVSARIRALPVDYDPASSAKKDGCQPAVSDSTGHYEIDCSDTATVTLTGRVPESELRFLLAGIKPTRATRGSAGTEAPAAVCGLPGRIHVKLPDSVPAQGAYVYLPGTTLITFLDSIAIRAGSVSLDTVPPGKLLALRYSPGNGSAPKDLAVDLVVKPETTLDLDPSGPGSQARTLRLNTTTSGVPVPQDLAAFPLLVRLNSGNFDFSQAQADGGDLRFAKLDGSPLAFQIEQWDRASTQAAIWVAMDTVFGNRNDQAITMHWGAAAAALPIAPKPVFDTASGYAGVWHLDESAPGVGNLEVYKNSVPGGTAGDDSVSNGATDGWIGRGLVSIGREFVQATNPWSRLKPAATLTVSAWVRPQGLDTLGSTILTMGNSYGLRVDSDTSLWFFIWDGTRFLEFRSDPVPIMDGSWHHVAGTFDGGMLRMYFDGKPVGTLAGRATIDYGLGRDFSIGTHGQGDPHYDEYRGGIDEVEVLGQTRSADWLRLEYESQRQWTPFLEFVP